MNRIIKHLLRRAFGTALDYADLRFMLATLSSPAARMDFLQSAYADGLISRRQFRRALA